jgi:hypothetical protein
LRAAFILGSRRAVHARSAVQLVLQFLHLLNQRLQGSPGIIGCGQGRFHPAIHHRPHLLGIGWTAIAIGSTTTGTTTARAATTGTASVIWISTARRAALLLGVHR